MDEYFVKDKDEEKGPFTFDELTDGRLEPTDIIRSSFTGWEKASDIADFIEYFRYEGYYFPTEANLAGFGIRLLAYIIDYIFIVIIILIGLVTYLATYMSETEINEFMVYKRDLVRVIVPIFSLSYFTILTASPASASLGQLLCKLIIVDENGRKVNFGKALIRCIVKFLSGTFFGIGFISIIFSEYKQGIHDVLAKTYVVRKDVF